MTILLLVVLAYMTASIGVGLVYDIMRGIGSLRPMWVLVGQRLSTIFALGWIVYRWVKG